MIPVLKSEKEKAVLTAFIASELFSAINSSGLHISLS